MDPLTILAQLSHEFGTVAYVRGGGGNTSFKDEASLWIKPSGTTLCGLTPSSFVRLERAKLAGLYTVKPPREAAAREALVKDLMMQSVHAASSGRPSVEAPLHDSFDAAYVVHTHPALVNGMTCAREGARTCRELFPDALWIDYTDPGYTVCMHVREELQAYAARAGRQPSVVFTQNHGVFVAGETPEEIRRAYDAIMGRLRRRYQEAGISLALSPGPPPPPEVVAEVEALLREAAGEEAASVCASGAFPVPAGPITPDNIVYSKAHPLLAEPAKEAMAAFRRERGYAPRVIACRGAVFGAGATPNTARLALELAQDGALVMQLAEAFGGIRYMSDRARDFIDSWEVEAYRRKLAAE
jgi:rhamnose utilization protein RhaD (predicted bifunctional aldolase and dehydrogenase)